MYMPTSAAVAKITASVKTKELTRWYMSGKISMTTAASISGYQVLWCDQLIGEICIIMNAVSASCAMSARARISGTSRTAVTSTISRVNATCTTDRAVAVR